MQLRHCFTKICAVTCYTFVICAYLRVQRNTQTSSSQPGTIASQVGTLVDEVLKADRDFQNESLVVEPIVIASRNLSFGSKASDKEGNLDESDFISYTVQVIDAASRLPISCPTGARDASITFFEVLIDGTVPNEHPLSDECCRSFPCDKKVFMVPPLSNRSSLSRLRAAFLSREEQASVLVVNVEQCNGTRAVTNFLIHLGLHEVWPTMTIVSTGCIDKDLAMLMLMHGHCEIRSPSSRWVFWALDWHMQRLYCGWRTVALVP